MKKQTNASVSGRFGMVGRCPAMRRVFRQIENVAAFDVGVLITGESGTGKDLVAYQLHRLSPRCDGPYLAVNTGAIPRELVASELVGHEKGAFTGAERLKIGKFEAANGGTLFLDEISTMDEQTQVSLLRILEQKRLQRVGGTRYLEVDVRVVAATNEDLRSSVKAGKFREDLFYRFNVFNIQLPPLRRRGDDVVLLAQEFLRRYCAEFGKPVLSFAPEALAHFREYLWPGNVRELENTIMRAVIEAEGDRIEEQELPDAVRTTGPSSGQITIPVGSTLDDAEKTLIARTLQNVGGNKRKAASILGISRKTLYNKLARHDLGL